HVKSKIGAGPQTMSLSDIEQTNRNDNSNYDSLIGSLKSDTVNWQDQQATVSKNIIADFRSLTSVFLSSI
ncbi:unnamed protein product, partial [Rotaria magnacalcarata]